MPESGKRTWTKISNQSDLVDILEGPRQGSLGTTLLHSVPLSQSQTSGPNEKSWTKIAKQPEPRTSWILWGGGGWVGSSVLGAQSFFTPCSAPFPPLPSPFFRSQTETYDCSNRPWTKIANQFDLGPGPAILPPTPPRPPPPPFRSQMSDTDSKSCGLRSQTNSTKALVLPPPPSAPPLPVSDVRH